MGDKIALIFGSMPDLNWRFLEPYRNNEKVTVVCADGGILRAREAGFQPGFYIGDNDSGGYFPNNVPSIRLNPEKDWSDLHAAYNWARGCGFTQVVFTGCSGGRQDHNLNNLFLLELAHSQGISAKLLDSVNEISLLSEGTTIFSCDGFRYFSLLPLDRSVAGVTIANAKYPLNHVTIQRTQGLTISNEPLDGDVTVIIDSGAVLLMKTQRI
ncbi:MAG: thiamine diphosphokinase [Eubacteriales bacterium]